MKKKVIDFNKMSIDEDSMNEMFDKHRVKILTKFINKNYAKNETFKKKAGNELTLSIYEEIITGLDKEFKILRDDSEDKNINELIRKKTWELVQSIYK